METSTVDLSNSLQEIDNHFIEARDKQEIEVSEDYTTGAKFIWQEVTYGPSRTLNSDNCYRGYLMIEPEDMPKVLPILIQLGEQRKAGGKRLDFKWLKRTFSYSGTATKITNIGQYQELNPTDPRIAIYGDTQEEVQEILATLANNPEWQSIESKRTNKFGGTERTPRRPGTNAVIINGTEYRSLNYNDKPGYSEDEAQDTNWRAQKQGTPTVMGQMPNRAPVETTSSAPQKEERKEATKTFTEREKEFLEEKYNKSWAKLNNDLAYSGLSKKDQDDLLNLTIDHIQQLKKDGKIKTLEQETLALNEASEQLYNRIKDIRNNTSSN